MSRRWYIEPVGLLILGAVAAMSCATPIREDPPSKLEQDTGTGGDGSGSSDASSADTSVTSNVTGTQTTVSASTTTVGTGGAPGDSTSSSSTTTGASDGGSGGGSSTTTTSATTGTGGDGNGGSGGGGASTTVGASTTGAGMTTGELPFMDDFESYTEDGPATLWNPMESDGGWTVVSGNGGLVYATLAEASNRNLSWAGDATWTNMRLEVDVRMSGGGDSTRIYFGVRAAERSGDSNKLDYYFGYLKGDGVVRIGKYIDGGTSDENDTTDTGVDVASWNNVAITVDGDAISMEVNGTVRSTHTLTGRDSGFVALGVQDGLAEFDNVLVTAP